ncbi:twin-arginine translocation signal domain-containing protein [Bradyrhizobium elkanii]|jgi:hypothetical protein|uniref:twin-arginine translocation signal domain-containing protein n=1 Tax=Bradyrhizobium elkanii TaxID=29448 RepID=UPI00272D5DFB|nr:twin-arginine translocation signal domain-containing protein [Bradyrhizobium elkanii]WLA80375.1 twin-arginine translocation signal domain-containing protein [Bradyrhizobium elkanii]
MADLSRRDLLVGAAAVAAAVNIPAIVPAPIAAAEVIPAWAVGTPGEFNWQHVVARTADEAKRIFRAEWVTDSCEGEEDSPCEECEFCTLDVDVQRVHVWDGKRDVVGADWLDAGLGTYCGRCSYECFADNGAKNVNGEAVCEECMKLADWDIVDPEYAAELRAEQEAINAPVSGTTEGRK